MTGAFTPGCPSADRLWSAAHGELSPQEVQTLTAHLGTCAACAAVWRAAMEFGDADAATSAIPPSRDRSWQKVALPLAAAIAIAMGGAAVYQIMRPPRTEITPAAQVAGGPAQRTPVLELHPPPLRIPADYALVWRGSSTTKDYLDRLVAALVPYRDGDYQAAAAQLAPLAVEPPVLPEPWFYLGVSHLMVGRIDDASFALTRARAKATGDLSREIEWYLAVADDRRGRVEAARDRLNALCAAPGSGQERACRGLRQLEGS